MTLMLKGNATSCNEFIEQPVNTHDIDHPYQGKFLPRGNISLTRYGYAKTGPYFVFLNIKINDPTFDTAKFNYSALEAFFRMEIYDSKETYSKPPETPFEESLFYINKYVLAGGNVCTYVN